MKLIDILTNVDKSDKNKPSNFVLNNPTKETKMLNRKLTEVEEPEEFRLTGKEVWRAATKEHEKELNDALGLKELKLNINSSVFDALEQQAKQQGIILKALVRQILTDHVSNQ